MKNNIQDKDLDIMLDMLAANLKEAKRLLNSGKFDAGRVKVLTDYVVETRFLLKQLEQCPHSPRIKSRLSDIRKLQKGYLELEGMVKEFRNDRS